MSGMTRRLGAVMVMVMVVGCKPPNDAMSGSGRWDIAGVWVDEGGAETTIEGRKRSHKVTQIIDHDDEIFAVRDSGWKGAAFNWSYYVPSTTYIVNISVIEQISEDEARTTWSNDRGDHGEELIQRISR
ncbi:MAG: hypothetical protein AAFV53_07930 [Myxococcota bacterium]